jgi:hypothetical protein
MAIFGFFFLLRHGEHTSANPTSNTQPFTLHDICFRVGDITASAATMDIHTITYATFVTLRFTRQKNSVENEVVGHARSGHNSICPVLAAVRRALHLRQHNAPPNTPLCTAFNPIQTSVTSALLTSHLRRAAAAMFHLTGFAPSDISARALRAGGAMALLCAKVDPDVIRLLGRWQSDQMLRYLHLQAYPQMHTFARLMFSGGNFQHLAPPSI